MNNIKLFGTDGIRGIVGKFPLEKKFISLIGDSSAYLLKKIFNVNTAIIGWDTRESSEWIAEILTKSFVRHGFNVLCVEVFTTGGIALLCKKNNAVGIVVSASHNPYQYNGIKFLSPAGVKISVEIEEEIEKLIFSGKKLKIDNTVLGKIVSYKSEGEKIYFDFLTERLKGISCQFPINSLSLVIDCGNGATSMLGPKFFGKIFQKVRFININPDGTNINSNCGAVYPEVVRKELNNGEIGVVFDGDADRVIFVDEKKNIRDGDYIIGILANEYKKNKKLKNSLVVVSVMSNLGLLKFLWSKNIKVIQCPVGDKYVSEYLAKYGGNLGGEQAGHIVLYDLLPTGDGMLTAVEVIKTMLVNKKKLYQLFNIFKKYPQVIKNVEAKIRPPIEKVFDKKLLSNLEKKISGRIVLRYSGTEPLLRIMVEGKNKRSIEKTANFLANQFLKYIKTHN
jgi:phosphoglucosamine mutase